jgi:hypothetical protein
MRRMKRLVLCVVLVGCGDDGGSGTPDAPPIDMPPDVMLCGAPTKLCGTTCLPVNEDELNCGDCGVECKGGEACQAGACTCPPAFVPAAIEPTTLDQFQSGMGIQVAIAPNIDGTINPLLVGYPMTDPVLDTDIDLSTVPLGQAPFVGAGYAFDVQAMTTDAAYVATAGTLRLTKACGTEAEGTLTDVTFHGVIGDLGSSTVTIDPDGCTFTVPSVAFHIGGATACP